jgi:hypothetical protein
MRSTRSASQRDTRQLRRAIYTIRCRKRGKENGWHPALKVHINLMS